MCDPVDKNDVEDQLFISKALARQSFMESYVLAAVRAGAPTGGAFNLILVQDAAKTFDEICAWHKTGG